MRPVTRPGSVIVVGGHSRGVGKTALVTEIVRALGSRPVATVKVSQHRHGHGVSVVEDTIVTPLTSTGRCLLAGAGRAFLCRCPDDHLDVARRVVLDLVVAGWTTVIESNRMASVVAADLTCFVVSPATDDWKASSWLVPHVDLLVTTSAPVGLPPAAARWLAGRSLRPSFLAFGESWRVAGLNHWLSTRLALESHGQTHRPVRKAAAPEVRLQVVDDGGVGRPRAADGGSRLST